MSVMGPKGHPLDFELKQKVLDGKCNDKNYFEAIESAITRVFEKLPDLTPKDLTKIVLTGGAVSFILCGNSFVTP